HFLNQENVNSPLPNYIIHQSEMDWPMRTALVAWILEIHKKLSLAHETFFLCINLIDRFLSLRSVKPESLQLIGLTSLMISCKYEEVICLSLDTFNNISKKISGKDILLAEGYILHSLKSNVEFVNPIHFLKLFCHCSCKNDLLFKVCHFVLVRLYLDEVFIKYSSSVKATCAYFLGTKILNEPFTLILNEKTKVCVDECVQMMKLPLANRGIIQFCEESEVFDVVEKFFMK
ncbi:G2/mitotic specific cyclin 2, partial [Tubulinosema ratisbonensis]